MKPTGDAECPPHIERAHQIDSNINERAGTRDLDDEDIADKVLVISDKEDNLQPKAHNPRVLVKQEPQELGPIARHSVTPAPRASCNSHTPGLELLTTISASLDPCLQAARDDKRTARTLQSTQVMSLSNQLRDAHMTINSLHDQLLQAEHEHSNAERHADRFEMQLQMAQVLHGQDRHPSQPARYVQRETRYTDGGASTIWVNPDEDKNPFHHPDEHRDIMSQQDYVEDPTTGRYTRHQASVSPIPARHTNRFQPITPRQSLSSRFNVSFTPTSAHSNEFSIVVSPSRCLTRM